MKTYALLLILFLTSMVRAHAQSDTSTNTGKIEMVRTFGSYKFVQNGQVLSFGKLKDVLEKNEEATQEIKLARTNNIFATILSSAGGFLVGYPLGTALGGGNPNWTVAGIGTGFFVASLPFGVAFNNRVKNAVELYNTSLSSSTPYKAEWRFCFTGNGLGLRATF